MTYQDEVARAQADDGQWFRVVIEQDTDAGHCNPRDHDGKIGVMVLGHRRYNLPCEDDEVRAAMDNHSFRVVERWLRMFKGATTVLVVYGYDHSGLSMTARARTYPYTDPWDSGVLGIVFDTEATRKETGLPFNEHTVEDALITEVEEYNRWSNGEVYGYIVQRGDHVPDQPRFRVWDGTDADPDDVVWNADEGSCWGHIGDSWAREAAREALDEHVQAYNADQSTAAEMCQPEYAGIVAGTATTEVER